MRAGGREGRLEAAAERRCDATAVRLVADDDDGLAAPCNDSANVVLRRAGRECVKRLRWPEAEIARGLACTQKRRRKDRVRLDPRVAQPLSKQSRLLVSAGRQCTELVGAARRCFGMANENEPHGPGP